jgi:hypothetical protein
MKGMERQVTGLTEYLRPTRSSVTQIAPTTVAAIRQTERVDVLGELVHEYQHAA